MPAALSHVTISASDLDASLAFYTAALAAIGLARLLEFGDEEEDGAPVEAVGWGSGDNPVLWLVPGPATVRVHVAFAVSDRSGVDAFHAAAVAAGGTSHDAPRRWALYRRGRYRAAVLDPDGNLLEVTGPE